MDTFCCPEKQLALLRLVLHFLARARELVKRGAPIHRLRETAAREEIVRAKEKIPNESLEGFHDLMRGIDQEMETLAQEFWKVR